MVAIIETSTTISDVGSGDCLPLTRVITIMASNGTQAPATLALSCCASATIVPLYGRLGDEHGRRNMLLVALGVFTFGSLACAAAQTLPQLVAARVLQGLGGGGLMTLSQALIGELVPPRERMRFQGYFALVFTSASIGGPVIGGLVVSHTSWRWLFLANLPFALFAGAMATSQGRAQGPAT